RQRAIPGLCGRFRGYPALEARLFGGYSSSPQLLSDGCSTRQPHLGKPKILDSFNDPRKLVDVRGLSNVAVGVEPICRSDVVLGLRGREDNDGEAFQFWIALDLCQYLRS